MFNNNNAKLIFISGLNKKHFAVPILNFLSKKMDLSISESKYNFIHRIRAKNKNIIWVEWLENMQNILVIRFM